MSSAPQELASACIDTSPGTYAVIFSCAQLHDNYQCQIGRLGTMKLKQGYFSYVGSAFGPGGLKARLAHHQRRAKKPHWHLDYLKPYLQIEAIWFTRDPARREHLWASVMGDGAGSAIALLGFGSSDCDCPTHLLYSSTRPELGKFTRTVAQRTDRHHPIYNAIGIDKKQDRCSDKTHSDSQSIESN